MSSPRYDRLLVLVPFRLSEIVDKGEVVDRYFNPGSLFRHVDIVMTVADDVAVEDVRPMVGDADLRIHCLPRGRGDVLRTLGWRPALLGGLVNAIRPLAAQVRPQLVRCYATGLAAVMAVEVGRLTGAPVVVSAHTIPHDPAAAPFSLRHRVGNRLYAGMERRGIAGADVAVAVYESLIPYLRSAGARRIEVAYNVLAEAATVCKESYALHQPPRLLSVGRLIPGKDPRPIVRALADLPGVALTIVGSGPLAADVRALAEELGVADRVELMPAVPNEEVCRRLGEYDVFVSSNRYAGIPKAYMEPMLAGLPVVSDRGPVAVPELEESGAMLTDGTPAGYATAVRALLAGEAARRDAGTRLAAFAEQRWAPAQAERRYVELYRSLLEG